MVLSAVELIKKSWHDYTHNWSEWIIFALLMFLPIFIPFIGGSFSMYLQTAQPNLSRITNVIVAIINLLSIFLVFWNSLALAHAVGTYIKEGRNDHWMEHYGAVVPLLWPALYTSIFVWLALVIGTAFFIIPGIIFLVWFFFSPYRIIFEKERGFKAIRGSKQLVSGRWWRVAWWLVVPLLAFMILTAAVFLMLDILISILPISPVGHVVVWNVISVMLTCSMIAPLSTIAILNLYFGLKDNPVK